jgi:hypothetical protein
VGGSGDALRSPALVEVPIFFWEKLDITCHLCPEFLSTQDPTISVNNTVKRLLSTSIAKQAT